MLDVELARDPRNDDSSRMISLIKGNLASCTFSNKQT